MADEHDEQASWVALIQWCREYHDLDGNGGSLHLFLSDGNYEREHVEFCWKWAYDHNDPEGAALANVLLELTDEQRERLYGEMWK